MVRVVLRAGTGGAGGSEADAAAGGWVGWHGDGMFVTWQGFTGRFRRR